MVEDIMTELRCKPGVGIEFMDGVRDMMEDYKLTDEEIKSMYKSNCGD